jgi:hypothetical protein
VLASAPVCRAGRGGTGGPGHPRRCTTEAPPRPVCFRGKRWRAAGILRDDVPLRRIFVTLCSMSSLEEPGLGWNSANVDGVRADALDVISDALSWQLAATCWAAIERVLVTMDTALAAGDVAALAAATADLELVGPVRITRIGAAPVVPPPPVVRDRLNRLVHSLGGVQAADQAEPGHEESSS